MKRRMQPANTKTMHWTGLRPLKRSFISKNEFTAYRGQTKTILWGIMLKTFSLILLLIQSIQAAHPDSIYTANGEEFTEKNLAKTEAYWTKKFDTFNSLQDIFNAGSEFTSQLSAIDHSLSDASINVIYQLHDLFSYKSRLFTRKTFKQPETEEETQKLYKIYNLIYTSRNQLTNTLGRLYAKIENFDKRKKAHQFFKQMNRALHEAKFHDDMKEKTVPDFEFQTTQGVNYLLSAFRGRYVLLHFWSMHSIPCIEELNDIKQAHKKYKHKSLLIISINTDPIHSKWDEEIRSNFVKEMGMDWMQVFDGKAKEIAELFYIRNYPVLVLIDKKGYAVDYDHRLGKALRGGQLQQTLEKVLSH